MLREEPIKWHDDRKRNDERKARIQDLATQLVAELDPLYREESERFANDPDNMPGSDSMLCLYLTGLAEARRMLHWWPDQETAADAGGAATT